MLEVIRDSTVLGEELGEKAGTLNDKKELYEQLFFLLSTRPEYIAQLAHKATKRQQDDFVKTGTFLPPVSFHVSYLSGV